MCLSHFFGEQSPFQTIVAIVAFATGGYTFYKSFLERADIAAFPGDGITLVISHGGDCRKFQLRANLVNRSVKMGTLNRLEAEITTPTDIKHAYQWRLFFEYSSEGQQAVATNSPHAVAVAGRGNELLFTEFEAAPGSVTPKWPAGRYTVKLKGWVNLENRQQEPNLNREFHFNIDENTAKHLAEADPLVAELVNLPIEEWALPKCTLDS